jgi:hypothetical protein
MTMSKDDSKAFEARRDDRDEDTIGKREGISLIRYAHHLFDQCNEGVNRLFTAEELLRIASACERSGWDMYPDQWTPRQLEEAATEGIIPNWEETPRGLVAVYTEAATPIAKHA